ncbi:MAG TPA: hypothetical protein VMT29_05155 [Steroidobacteraceae bacterium]|nr:hypothetical protein [Steroidobacteraceae bacterium]
MKRSVLICLQATPLLLIATFTVCQLVALRAGLAGILLGLLTVSWFFKYCFVVLDAVVAGEEELPVLSVEMVNPVDEQRPLALLIIAIAATYFVFWLRHALGAVGSAAIGLVFAALLPACATVLGITRNVFRAVSPASLLHLVRGLGWDYALIVVIVWLAAAGMYWLSAAGAPIWLLLAAAQFLLLLEFALLGGAVFDHRLVLGIETLTRAERLAERDAREHQAERAAMLDRAYSRFRVGKPAEGWEQIEVWMRQHDDSWEQQRAEYRAVLTAASAWDDGRAADRLASVLITALLAKRENGTALDVLEQRLAHNPAYRPSQAAQIPRLAELAGAAGKKGLQRRLTAPADPASPPADPAPRP